MSKQAYHLSPRRNSRLKKRVAAFFYSEKSKPGFTEVPLGGRLVGYVRGVLTPKHTTLIGVLDYVHAGLPGMSDRYPEDECFMNGHYAIAKAPKAAPPHIYIAVRGGVVQGVRYKAGVGSPEVFLVDYDNYFCGENAVFDTEEDFERAQLNGQTWAEIEQDSEGVF